MPACLPAQNGNRNLISTPFHPLLCSSAVPVRVPSQRSKSFKRDPNPEGELSLWEGPEEGGDPPHKVMRGLET